MHSDIVILTPAPQHTLSQLIYAALRRPIDSIEGREGTRKRERGRRSCGVVVPWWFCAFCCSWGESLMRTGCTSIYRAFSVAVHCDRRATISVPIYEASGDLGVVVCRSVAIRPRKRSQPILFHNAGEFSKAWRRIVASWHHNETRELFTFSGRMFWWQVFIHWRLTRDGFAPHRSFCSDVIVSLWSLTSRVKRHHNRHHSRDGGKARRRLTWQVAIINTMQMLIALNHCSDIQCASALHDVYSHCFHAMYMLYSHQRVWDECGHFCHS